MLISNLSPQYYLSPGKNNSPEPISVMSTKVDDIWRTILNALDNFSILFIFPGLSMHAHFRSGLRINDLDAL